MVKTMLRVLIPQDKYELREIKQGHHEVIKTGGLQTVEINGKMVEKVGGVVEDNIRECLGYVFNENKYDEFGKRKPETLIAVPWME